MPADQGAGSMWKIHIAVSNVQLRKLLIVQNLQRKQDALFDTVSKVDRVESVLPLHWETLWLPRAQNET